MSRRPCHALARTTISSNDFIFMSLTFWLYLVICNLVCKYKITVLTVSLFTCDIWRSILGS